MTCFLIKRCFAFHKSSCDSIEEYEETSEENASNQNDSLEHEIKKAQQTDCKGMMTSWKKGLGQNEQPQTLEAFKTGSEIPIVLNRKFLKIVTFGDICSQDLEILKIAGDYLQATHGIETIFDPTPLTLDTRGTRQSDYFQYSIESNLDTLFKLQEKRAQSDTFFLGFLDQDLYPYWQGDQFNFIFGIGLVKQACGLFSILRLKTSSFEQTLKRVMKLASHEFGHMQGLIHCTEYACMMQGSNGLHETDISPLIFCAEDMAKICYLNHWSLKEGYQNQLHFFENFFQNYGKKVDFSAEIASLKKKITKLRRAD